MHFREINPSIIDKVFNHHDSKISMLYSKLNQVRAIQSHQNKITKHKKNQTKTNTKRKMKTRTHARHKIRQHEVHPILKTYIVLNIALRTTKVESKR